MKPAKGMGLAAAILLVTGTGRGVPAADIVNGWSTTTTISDVYSLHSLTMIRLAGTSQTCGHPDYWQLPLNESAASKTKHALIIAAFMAGKRVSLRCENSLVSDFQIFE